MEKFPELFFDLPVHLPIVAFIQLSLASGLKLCLASVLLIGVWKMDNRNNWQDVNLEI